MKQKRKIGITVILVAALVLIAFGIRQQHRAAKEFQMQRQELHLDADGPMVLIYKDIGLVGCFRGNDIVRFVWAKKTSRITPGMYYMTCEDGSVRISTAEGWLCWNIKMKKRDSDFISGWIKTDVPVLVY